MFFVNLTFKMAFKIETSVVFSEESERSALNDTTIEERVTILEFQMADLTEDVTDLGEDVDVIDSEVAVILAGQIIQDERILELETDSEGNSKIG